MFLCHVIPPMAGFSPQERGFPASEQRAGIKKAGLPIQDGDPAVLNYLVLYMVYSEREREREREQKPCQVSQIIEIFCKKI
jgi:hypothetical protein